jgi:hypothetical protein
MAIVLMILFLSLSSGQSAGASVLAGYPWHVPQPEDPEARKARWRAAWRNEKW